MDNEGYIATKDLNEVAKIHSDIKYINWRMEFVDGEYRFYSPTYKAKPNLTHQETYASLEQLESMLKEPGYLCLGHGTGRSGNSKDIVDSIFEEGLRTKGGSLYYTTIGLDVPSAQVLKDKLDNWPHQDSKKIILARVPIEYINMLGDSSDLDGERFGAFTVPRTDDTGRQVSYLNSKFIVGCYDVEKQMVRLNKHFEENLSESTIQQLSQNYLKAVEKTKARLKRMEDFLTPVVEQNQPLPEPDVSIDNDESWTFDFPEIDWDIPADEMSSDKSR